MQPTPQSLRLLRVGGVRIRDQQAIQELDGLAGISLIALNVLELLFVTQGGSVDGVGNLRMVGVQLCEIPVVGESLLVACGFEIGVGDLEFGVHRLVAVGIVVDQGLEGLDDLLVVHVAVDTENRPALQGGQAIRVELVCRGHRAPVGIGGGLAGQKRQTQSERARPREGRGSPEAG